ncbi:MAG: hypothetical protein PHQ03_06710 [Methylococcales bacterium]|nr:hypothetical protein [Methylococcales bacterium]
MKKFPLILALVSSVTLVACGNGQKINAHNEKTAYKSVRMIKPRLQEELRVQYEMSFWMIRDEKKDEAEFLKTVDGKMPEEIIAMGKEIYEKRKAAGVAEYQEYKSWDDMMAKYDRDRMKQGKPKSDVKRDVSDPVKANDNINYQL